MGSIGLAVHDVQEPLGDDLKHRVDTHSSAVAEPVSDLRSREDVPSQLTNLFSDNVVLKIWKTATEHLERQVRRAHEMCTIIY